MEEKTARNIRKGEAEMTKRFHDNYNDEKILVANDGLRVLEIIDFNHDGQAINFQNIEWKYDSVIIKGNALKFQGDFSGLFLKGMFSSLDHIGALMLFRDALQKSLLWFQKHWIIEIETPPASEFAGIPKEAVLLSGQNYQEAGAFGGTITPYITAALLASLVGAIKAAEFITANWNGSEPIAVQLTIEGTHMAWQENNYDWLKKIK